MGTTTTTTQLLLGALAVAAASPSLLLAALLAIGCQQPNHERAAPVQASAPSVASAPPTLAPSGELFITTRQTFPGRSIIEEKGGFYCQFFQYSGTGDYGDRFRDALDGLRNEGKKLGANAFINASVSSESHEIQGSKWHASFVHICGDFVRLN